MMYHLAILHKVGARLRPSIFLHLKFEFSFKYQYIYLSQKQEIPTCKGLKFYIEFQDHLYSKLLFHHVITGYEFAVIKPLQLKKVQSLYSKQYIIGHLRANLTFRYAQESMRNKPEEFRKAFTSSAELLLNMSKPRVPDRMVKF